MQRTRITKGRWIAWSSLPALTLAAVAIVWGQSPVSAALPGNAANGRAIFEGAGNCLSCHRAGAAGAILAPNLSDVGSRLSPDAMKQLLLTPATKVAPKNRLYEIATTDGKTLQGKLLNQDSSTLQILTTNGDLIAMQRSQVRDGHFVDPPLMPSYQGTLTAAQIDDLVAYLVSLRAAGSH